jgi:hypothetical protein
MKESEIKALISLLDDPNESIYKNISQRLFQEGNLVIPFLEASYGLSDNQVFNSRIESILDDLRNQSVYNKFTSWVNDPGKQDLISGLNFVNQLYYTDTNLEDVKKQFDVLRQKVWIELNDNLTGFEAVKVLNSFFYDVSKFTVLKSSVRKPELYFVESLVKNKEVSVIPFIGMYCAIANSLDIPVYPVYLPGLVLMAYEDEKLVKAAYGKTDESVLFYINPYDNGSLLGRKALDYIVKSKNIPASDYHYSTLSNFQFIYFYLKYLRETNIITPEYLSYNRLIRMMEICNVEEL